jgi:two-component system, cell cycle sensor histidine kinase and response regulator CckA
MLGTVRVPADLEALFLRAEALVSRFFEQRIADPTRGTIEIFGERYILVRGASLSVEFFELVRQLYGADRERDADLFARNILFDLAHAIGKSDARNFHDKMQLVDPIEKLSAGPVHFSHAGWALVDIHPESQPLPDERFYLLYDHPYSFESNAWLTTGQTREFPVCIMNAGYSSGWCEQSFGIELVASEVLCRAKGDEHCRFIMAQPHRIEHYVERYVSHRPDLAERIRGYEIPDFFARKRAEEDLRAAHDDLERRVRARTHELQTSYARLQAEILEREHVERQLRQASKLEAIGRLAGGIAHDFNNLMSVILLRGDLLSRHLPAGDPVHAEILEIVEAARRAATLTRQLLAFSRVHVIKPERVDLSALVGALATSLVPLIGEQIALDVQLDHGGCVVLADPGQLEQVVMNLVVNARDAMTRGGRLELETGRVSTDAAIRITTGELGPGDYVFLRVSDSGAGIDDDTISKIFDPFFTTKPDGLGTGLGLSTVYGVVRQAGGGVDVLSSPGAGACFTLYFPAAGAAGEASANLGRPELARGAELILIVEDQESLRETLQKIAERCGYTVVCAGDPDSALAVVRQRGAKIALLLTDVVLPKMSGPELARRAIAMSPALRVLFMSGYAPDEALRDNVLAGTADFLQKPFFPDQLAHKLRQILDRPG